MFYLASQGNDYDEFSPEALVLREGEWHEIESGRVAIGDILSIRTEEQIAADARLIECNDIEIEVPNLTGTNKVYARSTESTSNNITESKNMVFAGGKCVRGHGKAIVVSTGEYTVHAIVLAAKKLKKSDKQSEKSTEAKKND